MQDGEVIHKQGYGIAQLEYTIPITPSTVFPIESESKQFTAYAVAMLAQQGKLSLDDDIRMYLPDLPDFGEAITIRNLIHHTSGLRGQDTLLKLAGWRIEDMITNDQILRLVKRQRELNFSPGEEHWYCNTGYTLLAEIVSAVTGQSFSEWTAENIFRPLGMTDTHFHDGPSLVVPNRAYAYIRAEGPFRKAVRNGASVGATGLFTTVEDLAKWVRNLDDARLGGPALRELIHTPGVLNNGDTLNYAFGLKIGEYKGLRTVEHGGGGDHSFNSLVVRFPDLKFAVIILSNQGNFRPGSMAPRVAEIYLFDKMLAEEPEDEEPEEEQPDTVPRPERADINPAVYDDYAGEYELRPGIVVTVIRDGDSLWAWPPGQGRFELIPVSETRFFVPAQDDHLTFQRNQQGKVTHYTVGPGEEGIQAMRIEPWAPEAAQLAEYAGEYANDELETSYTIAVREGVLSATLTWHDPITLTPTPTRDMFFGDTSFIRLAKFERDSENEITGFSLSGGRVRGVLFVRR
ncbi:MAG: serine hydrolase [Deltaproteobacteria bacterium]|nr:serine hydrolase [Deltaproteobacteria bacterium]